MRAPQRVKGILADLRRNSSPQIPQVRVKERLVGAADRRWSFPLPLIAVRGQKDGMEIADE